MPSLRDPHWLPFFAAHHSYVDRHAEDLLQHAGAMEMALIDPMRGRFLQAEGRILAVSDLDGVALGWPVWQFDDVGRPRPIVAHSIEWTLERECPVGYEPQWWDRRYEHPILLYLLASWVAPTQALGNRRPCDAICESEDVANALMSPSYQTPRDTRAA